MMNSKPFLIAGMVISFVMAMVLSVFPLKYTLASIRPMFMVMVLAFWVLYRSTILGVWVVFLVGIVADILLGTHLGHQAFCATLMAFVLRLFLIYAKQLSLMQAWVFAGVGLVVYQVVLWILQAFSYYDFVWMGFGSLIMSIALFPLVWYPLYWVNRQHKERAY